MTTPTEAMQAVMDDRDELQDKVYELEAELYQVKECRMKDAREGVERFGSVQRETIKQLQAECKRHEDEVVRVHDQWGKCEEENKSLKAVLGTAREEITFLERQRDRAISDKQYLHHDMHVERQYRKDDEKRRDTAEVEAKRWEAAYHDVQTIGDFPSELQDREALRQNAELLQAKVVELQQTVADFDHEMNRDREYIAKLETQRSEARKLAHDRQRALEFRGCAECETRVDRTRLEYLESLVDAKGFQAYAVMHPEHGQLRIEDVRVGEQVMATIQNLENEKASCGAQLSNMTGERDKYYRMLGERISAISLLNGEAQELRSQKCCLEAKLQDAETIKDLYFLELQSLRAIGPDEQVSNLRQDTDAATAQLAERVRELEDEVKGPSKPKRYFEELFAISEIIPSGEHGRCLTHQGALLQRVEDTLARLEYLEDEFNRIGQVKADSRKMQTQLAQVTEANGQLGEQLCREQQHLSELKSENLRFQNRDTLLSQRMMEIEAENRVLHGVDQGSPELEKSRRVYYQGIVYDVCNLLDGFLRKTVVCGTVEEPSGEVQVALTELIGRLMRRNAETQGLRDRLGVDPGGNDKIDKLEQALQFKDHVLSQEKRRADKAERAHRAHEMGQAALQRRVKELEDECFQLAAGVCTEGDNGLVGDDDGTPFCKLKRDLEKNKKLVEERRRVVLPSEPPKKSEV